MDRRGSYQIGFYHGGVGMSLRWTSVDSVINWISYFCILIYLVEPCFAQSPELTVQESHLFSLSLSLFFFFFFFWGGGCMFVTCQLLLSFLFLFFSFKET